MQILKRRKLFSFALFLGLGMCMARVLIPNLFAMLAAAIGLSAAALYLHVRRGARRIFMDLAIVLFFMSVFFAGAGYYTARNQARPSFETAYDIQFEGTIIGSPYIDEGGSRFVCALKDVVVEGRRVEYQLRLYLRGNAQVLDKIACGQKVSGMGHLFSPDAATNPHAFDFGDYLWRAGFAGFITAKAEETELTGDGGGLQNLLYGARKWLTARIYDAFQENPEIVAALALGDTRDIDADLREDYSNSGVAHLLSVSGLHITLVAAVLTFLLARITGARVAAFLSLAGIFAYAAVVGFRPSVLRAVLMYAVLCGAPLVGRTSDGSTRLALAFIVVLVISPLNLADAGFVLSFSASAGILWISPPLLKLVRADKLREKRTFGRRIVYYIISLAVVTIATQIATFPALALFYGKMPLYSLFANVLLVPYSLLSMYAALVGIAIPQTAFVADFMLTLLNRGVVFFANLPFGDISLSPPPIFIWLLFLAVSVGVSDMGHMRESLKPWVFLALPLLIVISCILALDAGCTIVFLDVGQADAAVIRLDKRTYVVDVGEDGSEVAAYIKGKGWRIDGVFLSHPHSDHAGGLGELAEQCEIDAVYVPTGWFDFAENEDIIRESKAVIDADIMWNELSPGDAVNLSKNAAILALESGSRTDDPVNDQSLILLLDYGEAEALFTGDAEVVTAPDVDVLKVSHHGAKGATDRKFVETITPEVAVFSVGRNNSYGHPSTQVIELIEEAGGKVYRTDAHGAIIVEMESNGRVTVETYIKEGGR